MLDGIPFGDLTTPSLLGIAILLLLTGRLVTRSALTDKIEEAERWRSAYEAEREARATADDQAAELLELARTTHDIIAAMFSNTERIRQSGEPDAISKKA